MKAKGVKTLKAVKPRLKEAKDFGAGGGLVVFPSGGGMGGPPKGGTEIFDFTHGLSSWKREQTGVNGGLEIHGASGRESGRRRDKRI